ncbi:MAG: hypothetical protein ACH350_06915 [Parachlamydiaceae bacterium]
MHTVEKFYKKDAKNGGFSKSMKFPKKSIEAQSANVGNAKALAIDKSFLTPYDKFTLAARSAI